MLFRTLAAAGLAATALAADPTPLLRIPRLTHPPAIDGSLSPGEWDGAAATSGFASLDLDWAMAPAWLQTTVWLGWDEANLYLAMRAPYGGAPSLARAWQHDDGNLYSDDHLEWQLLPAADRGLARRDGGGFFKLMVNPRGTVLDQRMDGAKPEISDAWESQAEVRTGWQDGAWITEMRLPVTALGAKPALGAAWIMQVMRTGGGAAFHTSWAPGGWLDWQRFPEVVFSDGPALQLLEVRPTGGGLDVAAALAAPAGRAVAATARLRVLGGSQVVEQPLAAAARTATTLHFAGLGAADSERSYELTVNDGEVVLGRWTWRCFPTDDPESLDLRELWERQRRGLGLLGTLAQLAKIGMPIAERIGPALERQDLAGAEKAARELVAALPWAPDGHRVLAAVLLRAGKTDDALAELATAVRAGDTDAAGFDEDLDFVTLRGDPRLTALQAQMRASPGYLPDRPAVPAPARRRAVVDEANCAWDAAAQQVVVHWLPGVARPGSTIATADDAVGAQLRAWWADGSAAGNGTDLYDNRDRGHSRMDGELYPQARLIRYRLEAHEAYLDDAEPESIRHQGPVVVVGNASQAEVVGPYRRCLPRRAMVTPRSAARLLWQYTHNQIYVYPACFDAHPPEVRNGLGDTFPALTPYWSASIGYSGTDQPCLRAVFATLAAFRPEVKRRLLAENRIAPTVQMILRRCLAGIEGDADYLAGRAHAAAYLGSDLRPERMIELAHGITADTLPPTVRLRVLEEDAPAVPGRDFFDAPGRTESFLDTPWSIGRVLRSTRRQSWRLVVGAEAGAGAKDHPLQIRWAVLRGTAEVVPNADGSSAVITVPWQTRHDAGGGLVTDRIDVVCAVSDGVHWSGPAYVSFYAPAHETRTYRPDGRLESVVYADDSAPYTDPMICLPKDWRDDFHYDAGGNLLGWTRTRGETHEEFDAEGRLAGPEPRVVRYRLEQRAGRAPAIVAEPPPAK